MREQLVQFSQSIYKDPPHIFLIADTALSTVNKHKHLTFLLADPSLSLAIVDAVSYGEKLDRLFAQSKNKIIPSSAAPMIMARMIYAKDRYIVCSKAMPAATMRKINHSQMNISENNETIL